MLLNGFKWVEEKFKFNEDFIKNYNEDSDEGYFFEVDIQYLENIHDLHNDLPFLPERMKIKKVQKLVADLYDKNEYVIHIRNLKHVLNHRLVLKTVHKAWLKPFIDMKTVVVFVKTRENVRKKRDIKLVRTQGRRNYFLSEPNYHTTTFFSENLFAIQMKKKIFFFINIVMYEFRYDHVKPKYGQKSQ